MATTGLIPRTLALSAALLVALPATAWAGEDDVGWPYRGPAELRSSGGDDDSSEDTGDTGAPGDGSDTGNENPNDVGGAGGGGGGPGVERGKSAMIVGDILWSWWWEHNKDRFLARVTEIGRVNPGSAAYWFGSGAKFPPRDITPITAEQKRKIFDVLVGRTKDKSNPVRKSACIALGRLGYVAPNEAETKAAETNDKLPINMCARVLLDLVRTEKDLDLKNHALLGLGLATDPKANTALVELFPALPVENQPYALIALGLARSKAAIPLMVQQLPTSAKSDTETELAAIHALGLFGPDEEAIDLIRKARTEEGKGKGGIEQLEHLATTKSGKDRVPEQAITTLARLQVELKAVARGVRHKSPAVKHASILSLAEYAGSEEDADDAFKALKAGYKGSQQTKNFVILAAGDLASRLLDSNSKTRAAILKWLHDKKQLGSNDNYTRACSAIALGVAGDKSAVRTIAAYLEDTTIDHYVAGACSVALGLLRAAEKADLVINNVVRGNKYNADAKGYGLLGLAMMGDTTRMDLVLQVAKKEQQKETQRQAPLAIGVLGDRGQTKTLTDYFDKKWKQNERLPVSAAVFGQAWIRDADSVEALLRVASTSAEPEVRAMAVIALGYIGGQNRVSGLTRCFAGANYKGNFNSFQTLYHISTIL